MTKANSTITPVAKTTFKVGTYNAVTDVFTSVVDLNDRASYWLVSVDMPQPKKVYSRSSTIRVSGETIADWNYQNRHIKVTLNLLYGANATALLAALQTLLAAIENPPYRLAFAAPNTTLLTYAEVVAVSHTIPYDAKLILNGAVKKIVIDFECLPGLLGDRLSLQNLVMNPGFEAPSGLPSANGVQVFSDQFANLNAYTLLAGGALTQDNGTFADQVLLDAPTRFYRLDEASGTTAFDAGSSGNNATYHTGLTLGVAGALTGDSDTAVTLNGTTGYASSSVSSDLPSGAQAFSVECWFKFAANPATVQDFLMFGDFDTANHNVFLQLQTTGALKFLSNGGFSIASNGTLTTGVYHHIVCAYDGTTAKFYIDGTLQTATASVTLAMGYVGSFPFVIGATSSGGTHTTPAGFFAGQLDEVAVYTGTALSSSRVTAHYNAGHNAPAAAANTMLVANGAKVSFGSPAWSPVQSWLLRWRWVTGLTATFYLHYTDANNYIAAVASPTAFTLNQVVAGVTHQISATTFAPINGLHYWLQFQQAPTVAGNPPSLQAFLYTDSGAAPYTFAAQIPGVFSSLQAFDGVTAITGLMAVSASGAALGLGGLNLAGTSQVNTVTLPGPGGWLFTPQTSGATPTGVASGSWDQNPANTYPSGVIISFAAARIDCPPAGTVDCNWRLYSGGTPASAPSAIPVAAAGDTLNVSAWTKSSGLNANAQTRLYVTEYDNTGAQLRQTLVATKSGNQASWTQLSATLATGASCAYADVMLRVVDTTVAGESANGTVWFDNAQVWDQTAVGAATGQTSMPYCELRFPQSAASLMVSGLVGDMKAPASMSLGLYTNNFPLGGVANLMLGRRATPTTGFPLVSFPILRSTNWSPLYGSSGGYGSVFLEGSINNGEAVAAFGPTPAAQPSVAQSQGIYRLIAYAFSDDANLALTNVRRQTDVATVSQWNITGITKISEGYGAYIHPFPSSGVWTLADAGILVVPPFPASDQADTTKQYFYGFYEYFGSSPTAYLTGVGLVMLLPMDAETYLAQIINASNALVAISQQWLYVYVDGAAPAAVYSIESHSLPNPTNSGGSIGTTASGALSVNPLADAYVNLDPTTTLPNSEGLGVNEFALAAGDSSGNLFGLAVDVAYVPRYLFPRAA